MLHSNQFDVFWLRESAGGTLGGDFGAAVDSLDSLPINETLAARIRALTPPGAAVSLHLPYLNMRDRKVWPALQLELPVEAAGDGRVVAGNEAEHQYAAMLTGGPLWFRDRRSWERRDWAAVVLPMLAAHGLRAEPGWEPAGAFETDWSIELAGECVARAWTAMPHRRERAFLDRMRGLSTAVQRALRLWLPFQYFSRIERYRETQRAHAYLAYAVLPPHPSRRKTQLTFHVLEPQRVVRSMARSGRPLAEGLRRAMPRIALSGADLRDYRIERAGEIVRRMQKLPRVFAALLSLEAFVVEEFVNFAAHCPGPRQQRPTKVRTAVEPGRALLHRFRCRLGRSYGGESFANLASLLLAAATAGLLRGEAPLRVRAKVREIESGREIRAESSISYANF